MGTKKGQERILHMQGHDQQLAKAVALLKSEKYADALMQFERLGSDRPHDLQVMYYTAYVRFRQG